MKSAKVAASKNIKKLTPEQRKTSARLTDAKQVGNYKLPDAPTSKGKGKGKGKGNGKGTGKGTEPDHRQWIPCPLLPGVPSIPLPRIPQPWEVLRSETTAAAEVVNDVIVPSINPPLYTLQGPLPGLTNRRAKRAKEMERCNVNGTPTDHRTKKRRTQSHARTPRTKASGSGRSAIPNMSSEIDVQLERDLGTGDNSGSEIQEEEDENPVDLSLRPLLNPRDAVVESLDEPNPTEAMELLSLDADEDQFMRNMAAGDVDILNFDWRSEYKNFEGVREVFTGPSGPTFDHSGMSPLQVFQEIWDTNIIDHIVRGTNNYARKLQNKRAGKLESRISRWEETTREEVWRFLSILMLQSLVVNNVEREYWYQSIDQMRIGNFEKIMPYNRFVLIKMCLYFIDNSSLPEHPSKLDEIMPVISHLNKKFGTLYLPEQNVAIDESLLLWKGRLSFSQKIATKKAREGIKSFELCESRTGYLWKMEVYSGKGHTHAPQEAGAVEVEGPKNAASQIVFNLMRPLFGKGHTLVTDNYYNSPLLSRLLKTKHQTDTMGTLRLNRDFVPEELKKKTKTNMKSGEVCFRCTKDICALVHRDKNIVPMISTFHQPEVCEISKHGYYKYRPKVISDYNLSMGGIDHKDQLLSSFPIERSKNLTWCKTLFRRLLNVSIHNAFTIHNHGRTGSNKLGNRPFRLQLLKEMLETFCDTHRTLQPPPPPPPTPPPPPLPPPLSQMHLPVKLKKTQRCKLCYKNKVRRTTVWSCGTCQVNLCIEGCYAVYHKELSQQLQQDL